MFESDLSDVERNVIFSSIDKFDRARYLEIGINFAGTFKRVLDRNKGKDFFAVGVDLFEDFAEYLDDSEQTHNAINSDLKMREGCVFHNGQHLHVAYMKEVQRALEDIGHDNFQLVKGDSSVVIHDLEGPFDVVFIDGNHSYDQTMRDFEAVISKCSSNAIILFHNATAYEAEFLYNGGPWKVCQEIKDRSDLIDFGLTERMWRFQIS